jgi:hypothetical protein
VYPQLGAVKKISTTFFHARISRSGKGRVSDFSDTRLRVEGVGDDTRLGPKRAINYISLNQ